VFSCHGLVYDRYDAVSILQCAVIWRLVQGICARLSLEEREHMGLQHSHDFKKPVLCLSGLVNSTCEQSKWLVEWEPLAMGKYVLTG
jgi:hypothetical protein